MELIYETLAQNFITLSAVATLLGSQFTTAKHVYTAIRMMGSW